MLSASAACTASSLPITTNAFVELRAALVVPVMAAALRLNVDSTFTGSDLMRTDTTDPNLRQ
jgi:hypothetical protein